MVLTSTGNLTLQVSPATYVEQAVVSLEIILLITFALWGIYSALLSAYIYFLTLSNKRPYIFSILLFLLYIFITAHTILSTMSFNQALTSETMIELTYNPSFLSSVASQQGPDAGYFKFLAFDFGAEVCYVIANLIADGILIYRCYRLWAARKSIIAAPIILYILNICLFVAGLVTEASNERNFEPPFHVGRRGKGLGKTLTLSLAFAIGTIVANLLLIALIAGRMFWLTKTIHSTNASDHTKKSISRLVAIILESGLLYPLTLVIGVCFLPIANPVELLPITAQTMGIAPTLMMVRVDLSASTEKLPEESSMQDV